MLLGTLQELLIDCWNWLVGIKHVFSPHFTIYERFFFPTRETSACRLLVYTTARGVFSWFLLGLCFFVFGVPTRMFSLAEFPHAHANNVTVLTLLHGLNTTTTCVLLLCKAWNLLLHLFLFTTGFYKWFVQSTCVFVNE